VVVGVGVGEAEVDDCSLIGNISSTGCGPARLLLSQQYPPVRSVCHHTMVVTTSPSSIFNISTPPKSLSS